MTQHDLIEQLDFPPIVDETQTGRSVTKSFSVMEGRKVFDENQKLLGFRLCLRKSPGLLYEIKHLDDCLILSCALNEDSMDCLKEDFNLNDFTKVFEGLV